MLKAACAAALLVVASGCERPMGNAAVEAGKEGAPSAPTSDAAATVAAAAPPPPPSAAVPAERPDASPPMMPPSNDLVVRAHMHATTIKRGGDPVIVFELQNKTQAPLFVPHPTETTFAVTLRVTMPSGDVRVVSGAPLDPAAGPRYGNVQLAPGRVEPFEMDLGSSLTFDQPGPCTVVLEYPWRPGQVWTSTLHFVVK